MNRYLVIAFLALAALLEAGGDALVRFGLKSTSTFERVGLFLLGAVILFAYALVVNAPSWSFGELLGLYVVFFFLAAQLISWLAFAQPPGNVVLLGGALIVAGGLLIVVFGGIDKN
jgi:small multidrug resistance family-3 protein